MNNPTQKPENKTLPQSWREVRLGDVGRIITGKTPATKTIENFGNEYMFVTPRDMLNQKYIVNTERKLSKKGFNSVRNNIAPQHSIAVSCIGSDMGKVLILTEECVTNQQINSIVVQNEIPEYVYYDLFLRQGEIKNSASGSAVPILNKGAFSQLKINLPPLPEQKAIAHILGSLDDKIELNRQINKTLEDMAQALFKSWFVNFDPVIDNALKAGNPIPEPFQKRAQNRKNHQQKKPLPAEIQNLFPSEFEHHEKMGWIPKGWEVVKLDNIVDAIIDNRGKTPPNDEKSKIPLVEVNAIKGFDRFFNKESVKKYVNIDIYNSWFRGHPEKDDVLISTVGSIGEIALVGNEIFCTAQNIIALKSKNKGLFLFELLKFHRKNIINLDISSVQPSIKVPHLLNIKILKPSNLIIEAYINKVLHLSKKIEINNFQNQTLTQLRDTLLPKLISGKIRVGINI